jgi:bifunctional DNA-binding transcriptional regulator/antitoxin component of YhaV-PrlF toxin-antitoxin module
MTVTLKPKTELTVPESIRRKAGYQPGDRVEFKVSGRTITIVPKLTPDEIEDERELRDPRIRTTIRRGYQEFLAGKTRPAEMLQEELARIAVAQAAAGRSGSRRRRKA